VRQPSIPLDGEPSTGEPDAGEPPVRFGGKGGAETRLSYPYRFISSHEFSACGLPRNDLKYSGPRETGVR
jgi:hypothetical protein